MRIHAGVILVFVLAATMLGAWPAFGQPPATAPATQPYRPTPDEQKLLVRIRADIEAKKDLNALIRGQTLLHLAAREGYVAAAELLLRNGADPNARTASRQTPLHFACMGRRISMPGGAQVWLARKYGLPVARLLLAAGVDVKAADVREQTPLHHACRCGDPELAKVLLDAGADKNVVAIDETGRLVQTPLLETALGGMETPPGAASRHVETALLLLRKGAKTVLPPDGAQVPPLYWAAARGLRDLAGELIKRGAPVDGNAGQFNGRTPLLAAVESGDAIMVTLLLDAGASINAADAAGVRAVDIAVDKKNLGMLELLVRRRAAITGVLKRAEQTGQGEAVRRVLDKGDKVNDKSPITSTNPSS